MKDILTMTHEELIKFCDDAETWDSPNVQESMEYLSKWYCIDMKNELGEWKSGDELLKEIKNAYEKGCD